MERSRPRPVRSFRVSLFRTFGFSNWQVLTVTVTVTVWNKQIKEVIFLNYIAQIRIIWPRQLCKYQRKCNLWREVTKILRFWFDKNREIRRKKYLISSVSFTTLREKQTFRRFISLFLCSIGPVETEKYALSDSNRKLYRIARRNFPERCTGFLFSSFQRFFQGIMSFFVMKILENFVFFLENTKEENSIFVDLFIMRGIFVQNYD